MRSLRMRNSTIPARPSRARGSRYVRRAG